MEIPRDVKPGDRFVVDGDSLCVSYMSISGDLCIATFPSNHVFCATSPPTSMSIFGCVLQFDDARTSSGKLSVGFQYLKPYVESVETTEPATCKCDINTIMCRGCVCGALQIERQSA